MGGVGFYDDGMGLGFVGWMFCFFGRGCDGFGRVSFEILYGFDFCGLCVW